MIIRITKAIAMATMVTTSSISFACQVESHAPFCQHGKAQHEKMQAFHQQQMEKIRNNMQVPAFAFQSARMGMNEMPAYASSMSATEKEAMEKIRTQHRQAAEKQYAEFRAQMEKQMQLSKFEAPVMPAFNMKAMQQQQAAMDKLHKQHMEAAQKRDAAYRAEMLKQAETFKINAPVMPEFDLKAMQKQRAEMDAMMQKQRQEAKTAADKRIASLEAEMKARQLEMEKRRQAMQALAEKNIPMTKQAIEAHRAEMVKMHEKLMTEAKQRMDSARQEMESLRSAP